MTSIKKLAFTTFKKIIYFFGCLFIILIFLSFTDLPYYAYHTLAATDIKLKKSPTHIVIMGGVGMPSPDGLIKTYYGAKASKEFPNSKIIIALPQNEEDSLYQLNLMKKSMIQQGVDSVKILFEPTGFNTYSQAIAVSKMIPKLSSILIITNPEHMLRSIKTFKKKGFKDVGGKPAFEKPSDENMLQDDLETKDKRVKNVTLRYNIWSYLQYEIKVLREYCALTYYWFKGYI